jgi:hypothetical protein
VSVVAEKRLSLFLSALVGLVALAKIPELASTERASNAADTLLPGNVVLKRSAEVQPASRKACSHERYKHKLPAPNGCAFALCL